MTSLLLGVVCVVIAAQVLRTPPEKLHAELRRLSGFERSEGFCRFIRALFWLLGAAGAAIILLRFWD